MARGEICLSRLVKAPHVLAQFSALTSSLGTKTNLSLCIWRDVIAHICTSMFNHLLCSHRSIV
ncbi:ORF1012 [White spot syndrome virus]|uniref:ORF1012 n=1 Tax=White spot syndrome virus TaxID=342409 RepID=A0A2D3I6X6_9VIRU|nr:ORF1012 [White spot syndrome virus]